MNPKHVAPGVYRRDGVFYERPHIAGKRTWRKLWSANLADAKREVAARRSDQARAHLGLAKNPYQASRTVAEILQRYQADQAPKRNGKPRSATNLAGELWRIAQLQRHFQKTRIEYLDATSLRRYGATRTPRSAELELHTLKSALHHAINLGLLDQLPVNTWPHFHQAKPVRHCRDTAPTSADELHQLAKALLDHRQTEPLAWLLLILSLTGCRRSEILELKMRAGPHEPGHVENQWLWIQRRKGGVNPFALIHPDLRECIEAHHRWHQERFPKHPAWFPHRYSKTQPCNPCALQRALKRIVQTSGLPHRTVHGLRAYYVTTRRSQGIADSQIAAEIGDLTGAAIVAQVYGAVPPNWRGEEVLTWRPKTGPPAWAAWLR